MVSARSEEDSEIEVREAESKRGRPRIYSDEKISELAEYIASGLTDQEACALADVNYNTFRCHWQDYEHFREPIEKAKARKKAARIAVVEAGGEGWQGTARVCEFAYPQFRRGSHVVINNHNEVHVDMSRKAAQIFTDFGVKLES